MTINKFQRLKLTFDLSANVAYWSPVIKIRTLFSQKPLGQLNSNSFGDSLELRGVN